MSPLIADAHSLAAWRCTAPLRPSQHRAICQAMALDAFKWDGQVGDVTTLADFAVVLPKSMWRELERLAEALAAELVAAETELASRPDLWRELGLPALVRKALRGVEPWTPAAARVVRIDLHPTAEGWRLSEANSDVPGGYTEASIFPVLMAAHADGAVPAGNPTTVLCDALVRRAQENGRVALLTAPGYTEDQQVVAHLAAALRARGTSAACVRPEQLQWQTGMAHVVGPSGPEPVDVIFRFYQGEWMTRISGGEWRFLFRGGRTAVCNPAAAVLSESKRLPLLWNELSTAMPTWRRLMPSTQSVRATHGKEDWVLKRSYSNNGDSVLSRRWSGTRDYALAFTHGHIAPAQWAAQQWFETLPLETPAGLMRPCLGVYVVDGRACGIYGRLTAFPLIDYRAIDTPVLVEDETT